MSQHLALGLLVAFLGYVAISLICLWLDIRRAVAAALPDSSGDHHGA